MKVPVLVHQLILKCQWSVPVSDGTHSLKWRSTETCVGSGRAMTLASGLCDGTVWHWNAAKGVSSWLVITRRGRFGEYCSMELSSNGSSSCLCLIDKTVRFTGAANRHLLSRRCEDTTPGTLRNGKQTSKTYIVRLGRLDSGAVEHDI